MQVTRILAIRHGETDWNVQARIQGHRDIALNHTGLQQAQRLAQYLAQTHAQGERLNVIYSSDLSRARSTAQALAQAMGLGVRSEAGLRERCFGDFEGRTFAEVEQTQPTQAQHWRTRTPDWTPPGTGGESLLALRERVVRTVDALAAGHVGEHIVLVTHGGVLDALYRAATHLPVQAPRTWQLPNTAVNRLLWTPQGLSLVGWADTSHLQENSLDEI